MVEASKQIVDVFVDCDWGKKNTDLSGKYGVRGYPTVIFTDADGKQLEELQSRDPDGVLKQINDVAKKAGAGQFDNWDAAAAAAKKAGKPVLYIFTVKGLEWDKLEASLTDPSLKDALDHFIVVKSAIKRDSADAKRFMVATSEQPVILVLDPNAEKPEAAPLKKIVGKKTAKELLKEFQSIPKPPKGN